jgi:PKD repeat protein
MKKITFIVLVVLFPLLKNVFSQDTLVLQPGPEGKDAKFCSITPDQSNGNVYSFVSMAWTHSGEPGNHRSVIEFDLSDIPPGGEILNARLNLYFAIMPGYPTQHTGNNESYLQLITEEWQEETVTWNNQPSVTTEGQVYLPASTQPHQDYRNIDVTELIRKMYDEPQNYHGFLFRLITEEYYRCLVFASGDYMDDPALRPKLEIIYISCEPPAVDYNYELNDHTVSFTGISPTATSWQWDFGDGETSDLQNPQHTYALQGIYQVCLRVDDACYFAEHCENIAICYNIPPVAAFTYVIDDQTVTFHDASEMADSYYWDFGDGYYSNLSDPFHIYDYPGQYEVCQMTWNACGSDTACEVIELCLPSAKFSFEVDGLNVYFQNESNLADSYYWDFGDGYFSDLEDPWHAYETDLNYLVCLMITNECGSDTACDMIELAMTSISSPEEVLPEIYPNPAANILFIRPKTEGYVTMSITDLNGKEVLIRNVNMSPDETIKIDISQIGPGLYIVRFDSGKSQSHAKLVVAR